MKTLNSPVTAVARATLASLLMACVLFGTADARGLNHGASRTYYGGGHHTYSHGGSYRGGYGSSHRGGYYLNSPTANHYGRHR